MKYRRQVLAQISLPPRSVHPLSMTQRETDSEFPSVEQTDRAVLAGSDLRCTLMSWIQ
jgi:hypothetical protein